MQTQVKVLDSKCINIIRKITKQYNFQHQQLDPSAPEKKGDFLYSTGITDIVLCL